MIIYGSCNVSMMLCEEINALRKGKIGMLLLSISFFILGICGLTFFQINGIFAYGYILIGAGFMLLALIHYPRSIRKLERILEKQQHDRL